MAGFFGVILIATLSAGFCRAQTGSVTFYNPRYSAKVVAKAYLPKSEQPLGGLLGGWLFDGPRRLARIRTGHFATFHLSAGEHSFTDADTNGTSKKPLVIDVEDGGRYCVRLFAKVTNFEVYDRWQNQIEEVPCQQAQAAHLKRIAIKRVEPAVRAEFDLATTFPTESKSTTKPAGALRSGQPTDHNSGQREPVSLTQP